MVKIIQICDKCKKEFPSEGFNLSDLFREVYSYKLMLVRLDPGSIEPDDSKPIKVRMTMEICGDCVKELQEKLTNKVLEEYKDFFR